MVANVPRTFLTHLIEAWEKISNDIKLQVVVSGIVVETAQKRLHETNGPAGYCTMLLKLL